MKKQLVGKDTKGKRDKRVLTWEYLEGNSKRMPVFGGWLVAEYNVGMVFIPDPKHEWLVYSK